MTHALKPEIVAPAGNLEKLKFAVHYGADAVYFGGDEFNLRIKASNFSPGDLQEAARFCKSRDVKTVFLLNSFLHEANIGAAKKYINSIKEYNFDALMISDPGMMVLTREAGVESSIHLSTQMNTLNHLSIKFWNDIGFSRIVLGRETSLDEIKMIRDNSDADIEIFAHGALCVSYSGRCLLSRYLTGRDANLGDCSHPCRWNFSLIEKMRPDNHLDIIEHADGTEILSSKDLCLIGRLPAYIAAGVNAFKIEGRMKSLYYAANTTRIYKHGALHSDNDSFADNLQFYNEELDLISHRPFTDDLFNEFDNMGFTEIPYIKKALFLGCRDDSDGAADTVRVKTFNPIYKNETIDVIFPIEDAIRDKSVTVKSIIDDSGNSVDMAQQSRVYTIVFDSEIYDYGIFRRRLQP